MATVLRHFWCSLQEISDSPTVNLLDTSYSKAVGCGRRVWVSHLLDDNAEHCDLQPLVICSCPIWQQFVWLCFLVTNRFGQSIKSDIIVRDNQAQLPHFVDINCTHCLKCDLGHHWSIIYYITIEWKPSLLINDRSIVTRGLTFTCMRA